jgi:hypothetical protein
MAVVLAQVGTTLRLIDPSTGTSTILSLPDGVTIDSTRTPSIATLARGAVIVYSPTRNLLLLADQTLILLVPAAPATSLTAATGAAGVLTGTYQYAFTFIRKDADDNVITESPMSALSNTVTPSAQQVNLSSIDVSTDTDTVTGRRLYRTLSGGSLLYHLDDIDDNTTTVYVDNIPDATLSLLPSNEHNMVGPPGTETTDTYRLKRIISWKNRIWGVSDNPVELDLIRYTEDGLVYQWPNSLTAYPKGVELHGVIAFAPRRDQLGIMKRGGLWQITGDSDANFRIIQISVGKGGCVAARSVVTINDVVYWLGPDSIYEWNSSGVRSITDDTVRPWFISDRYFDRDQFPSAFAKYNPIRTQYELHLVDVNESTSKVWVAYNITNDRIYGPHRTDVGTLTCTTSTETSDGIPKVLVGSSTGQVYTLTPGTYHDGTTTPIEMEIITPYFSGNAPDIEHFWGELSILSKIEDGGTLSIYPTVGRFDATEEASALSHDLTLGRERLARLGTGAFVKLRLYNNQVDQPVTIQGIEIPFHEIGRR